MLRLLEGNLLGFWCDGCESMHHVNSGWAFNGNYDKPTFTPSILVKGVRMPTASEADLIMDGRGHMVNLPPTVCHSFVTDGRIQFLGDCTHKLAGQTIPLRAFG